MFNKNVDTKYIGNLLSKWQSVSRVEKWKLHSSFILPLVNRRFIPTLSLVYNYTCIELLLLYTLLHHIFILWLRNKQNRFLYVIYTTQYSLYIYIYIHPRLRRSVHWIKTLYTVADVGSKTVSSKLIFE